MSAERPSAHPLGYWLGSTPAAYPAHAWPDWLLELMGPSLGAPPAAPQEQEQPTYPVPYGPGGNVLVGRPMRRVPLGGLF